MLKWRLPLCGCYAADMFRQKQGITSCCTCVAGNGAMSATMATCCRRRLPGWWIAEPAMGVEKNTRIHFWYTWYLQGLVTIQWILRPRFLSKIEMSQDCGTAFYLVICRGFWWSNKPNPQNARAVSNPSGRLWHYVYIYTHMENYIYIYTHRYI